MLRGDKSWSEITNPRTKNRTDTMATPADEAMKAFQKGQNTGSMFKLDLDVMKKQRINAESYVRVWLTAWQNKLSAEELEIAKKHKILWMGQTAQIPANYPISGVPQNTAQTLAIAQSGKCGNAHRDLQNLDAQTEGLVLSIISGDVVDNAENDYYATVDKKKKAMESFRHYATVALGEKLNGPFDQGLIMSYNQLLKWVYKKCEVTRTMESMDDCFKDIQKALNENADTDCKMLKFRLAIAKLYQDGSTTEIPFPDIEDEPITLRAKEEYTPIQSLMFLYNQWCLIDSKTWTAIEDEFRGEIGGTNYTKANWMLHKPRLFEIIDQRNKGGSSRSSISVFQHEDPIEDDAVEIEIEPGVIMYMAPKGPKNKRPSNWKQKVQKYTAAAKRGSRSNFNQNQNNSNNQNRSSNWNNQPANHWNCKICPQVNGKFVQHKRGQKCPTNNFIPQRMIAMVQDTTEKKDENSNENEQAAQVEMRTEGLRAVKIAPAMKYYNYDSSDSSDKSE